MLLRAVITILIFFVTCLPFEAQQNNPNGYNKFYYENGKLSSEGYMIQGKPDGYWINYYKNGNIKIEGNRKNFLLDSIWKFYDERGKVTKTVTYLEGKKNGPTTLFDTAQKVVSIENFKNDFKQGQSITYHTNGKIKTISLFNNGKQEGYAYEYNKDSVLVAISYYKGGILQSFEKINQKDEQQRKQGIWKEFDSNMVLRKEQKFNDDSLDGYVKLYDNKGNLLKTKKYNYGKEIINAPEIANVEVYKEVFEDGTLKYEGVYVDGLAIGTHYKYIKKLRCDSTVYLKDDSNMVYARRLVCKNTPIPDSAIEYFDGVIVASGAVDSIRNRIGVWNEYHNTGEFKAKGNYKEGFRTGEWEFYYASGKLEQKGKYDKKGRMQGAWKWYYENGAILREEFYVNGKREGELKDYNEDGSITLVGEYIDDKKEGLWTYETKEYLEIGKYSNDEPDSLWKTYYMPGKSRRFEGAFLAGDPEGIHVAYFPNGQKMYLGKYVGGMKDGDWKYFDELGTNFLTITYKNDIEIKWQGDKIRPTYEESLRTYNIKINENKTQTIRK
ncbi:MAG: hypothetical protein MUF75_00990 [Bacteroidia bacterium]|jgi:antitoxin component YwqK of YwqJK toxin-antitoxin module|nr:hypothetical protein [Bacteroidia bacterium]